jgi:hypothetical protein
LRELVWIFEGKRRYDWEHTSSLICIHAEINRDRKKRSRPFEPWEFSPVEKPVKKATPEEKRENWLAMLARFKAKSGGK